MMLQEVYGSNEVCYEATTSDRDAAKAAGTSLTYGEIHHEGVRKLMDRHHLNVKKAKVMLDIGSGSGKLAIQCFDRYKLDRVIGVEISSHRYGKGVAALQSYAGYINKNSVYSASYRCS